MRDCPFCIIKTESKQCWQCTTQKYTTYRMSTICVIGHSQSLTILATKSPRWSPYLATTGRRTSVTGFVGFAFNPTDLLMGTRSSLKIENRVDLFIVKRQPKDICLIVFPTFMTWVLLERTDFTGIEENFLLKIVLKSPLGCKYLGH